MKTPRRFVDLSPSTRRPRTAGTSTERMLAAKQETR
jgi:hypothetical protein